VKDANHQVTRMEAQDHTANAATPLQMFDADAVNPSVIFIHSGPGGFDNSQSRSQISQVSR
jgi:hypothetical protein